MSKGDVRRLMEYYRTDKGVIIKAKQNHDLVLDLVKFWDCTLGNIIKHSKDIIDLIEVGDYINGERVTYKGKTKTGRTQIITEDSTDFFLKYEYIETILTHEQYEQNCYEVGED